jgi:hypothetical protein
MYALRIAGGTPIRCAPAANACVVTSIDQLALGVSSSLTLPLLGVADFLRYSKYRVLEYSCTYNHTVVD